MRDDGTILTFLTVGALAAAGATRRLRGTRNKDLDEDNWVYEDQTLGTFTVRDGQPDWTDIRPQDMRAVLLETGEWSKSDFEVIDLKATVWDLMEARHKEEMDLWQN